VQPVNRIAFGSFAMQQLEQPIWNAILAKRPDLDEEYASAGSPYRLAGPYAGLNFGLVDIDWSAAPPRLTLTACKADGSTAFRVDR
jgi:hypothetical protein